MAAAQQHLGERAAAGGISAAWLYGMVPQPPPVPHLLVPHHLHLTTAGVAIRRSRHVTDADRAWVRGLSIVSVPFLMASLAAHMPADRLHALALDARDRRLLDIVDAAIRLEAMPRIPGRGRLVKVLSDLETDGGHSAFALRVRQRLHDDGFAPGSVSTLTTFASEQSMHLDVAFAPERVAVECIEFLGPRPAEAPARASRDANSHRQRGRDRRRDHTAALASDWLVLTLTWNRFMHDWQGFVAELREALETRSPGMWGGGRPVRLVDTTCW
jgi:AbiEi antitoxin C-terminal domain